jgi:hypothetical protein
VTGLLEVIVLGKRFTCRHCRPKESLVLPCNWVSKYYDASGLCGADGRGCHVEEVR